ncbi:MAG: hypothetical protein BroJett018_30360 [Chloroflexota bacterium]|nr:hypothetical protein [Chloroflexota bacterium]NOG65052.1 hypothetical protein [Chloroflexota bacterium]GIK65242.1 MAG: hypothetical protein BroJett018_30360 [Chloroflexota bacterium]
MNYPNNPVAQSQMRTNFREADLEVVMEHIHAGKSVEIIGLGSVGKSNFIRRLMRKDVQDRYLYQLYQEQSHCIFIGIDANSLLEPMPSAFDPTIPSGWSGYELIASRLLQAVMDNQLVAHITNPKDASHPESLYALYHKIWPSETAHSNTHIVAFRYLEDLMHRIFAGSNHGIKLIFIFDEFEKMLRELPPRFFQSLRSLRDQYKDRIMYITTARQILPLLVAEELHVEYEAFFDLFVDTRHFLLPYRPSDAEQTFQRMSSRQDYSPPPAPIREQMMLATGGHAGLLRAAFSAWEPKKLIYEGMSDTQVVATLLNLPATQEECSTIWRSLSNRERRILFEMTRLKHQGKFTDYNTLNPLVSLLVQKGILLETDSMSYDNIRPPVFAGFLFMSIPSSTNPNADSEQLFNLAW